MKLNQNPNMPQPGGKRPRFNIYWIWMALAIGILSWGLLGNDPVTRTVDWNEVKGMIEKGDLQKIVVINKENAEVYLKADKVKSYAEQKNYQGLTEQGPQFTFTIGSLDYFQHELENTLTEYNQQVPLSFETRRNMWSEALSLLFPIIILLVIWWFLWRGMSRGSGGGAGGGIFNVGKAKAQVFDKDAKVEITFKDVAGLEEAKVEIMEIVDFLKNPGKYNDLGGKIPKGALLVGPPGTGKTLLAKAVAGEANVPFFSISGSDFVEMFVGVGASRVRDLFRQAKEKAPCIVFIDEIDAIGRARSKNVGFSSNDERENTLNQLLTEMDGFGTNVGVIILAATNRADILDKALLRAGRFDRQINVELPDLKERREIFEVHLAKLKLDPQLDRDFLARQTPGFSGADIANVCNEAALIAARHDKKQVEKADFLSAIDRIIGGLERKNKIITPSEKRTIAYHEAGHATVSWLLEHANPLIKVTIIPRGKALGAAWYLPEERQITTTEQMLDEMASILGGRASEVLNFGTISTGALNDLERVTKQAYAMVSYYGMSQKIGNRSFYDSTGQADMALSKPYSEQTAEAIDDEANKLIKSAFDRATQTLESHRAGLTELAELLLEREVIFAEDLEKIFGKRKGEICKESEVKVEEPMIPQSDESAAE
ncbi:MAG: ATP-dependent zinc metalloprotease FtsH [Alistipes sp.]|nr:ATP-dependent zinc metalloprotease FtsH [Alistipes sp.]